MTPLEAGLLCGTLWAVVLVVWALADQVEGEPHPWLLLIQVIYDGFDFSLKGLVIGGSWAFADGFISGYLVAKIASWIW